MNDIRELMTTGPLICTPLTSIENIQKIMKEGQAKEIFVVDTLLEKHFIGIIHGEDIFLKATQENVAPSSLNAEKFIRALPVTIRETANEKECLRLMDLKSIDQLVVTDEEGHLCGVYHRQIH